MGVPYPLLPLPAADQCPTCGAVHGAILADQECPEHGHLLMPWHERDGIRLTCPARICRFERWIS